jgi:hypothetical protein
VEKHRHGRRWAAIIQMHSWMEPDQATILDRMRRRRAHRLAGVPAVYHATTGWAADHTGESADPYCADCKTDGCRPWMRIQTRLERLERQRWRQALADGTPNASPGGWGGDAPWPF